MDDPKLFGNLPVLAVGRRKSAVAQIQIKEGSGLILINGKIGSTYMRGNLANLDLIREPFTFLKSIKEFDDTKIDTIVTVHGGGLKGQANAIKLGISRACVAIHEINRQPLKRVGYLTRDARSKERKKFGLKKARKAPQYSKR